MIVKDLSTSDRRHPNISISKNTTYHSGNV